MSRSFTMRRTCKWCRCGFTINGSNHWFCGNTTCTKERRRADRQAAKQPKPGSREATLKAIREGK